MKRMRIGKCICLTLAIAVCGCAADKPGQSAKDLYIQARAIEDRTAGNAHDAQENLREARDLYTQALERRPSQGLEAYIRSGLANVSFFLDDYSTAIEQWTTAYPHLGDTELKAWSLYRIGLSQQRLGRFEQADKTFWRVEADYPGSVPAERAKEKAGARQFYLQLAAFVSASTADAAAAELRKQGIMPLVTNDASGKRVMKVGPYSTYSEARASKTRMSEKFPDSMIVP